MMRGTLAASTLFCLSFVNIEFLVTFHGFICQFSFVASPTDANDEPQTLRDWVEQNWRRDISRD